VDPLEAQLFLLLDVAGLAQQLAIAPRAIQRFAQRAFASSSVCCRSVAKVASSPLKLGSVSPTVPRPGTGALRVPVQLVEPTALR
jgi:hypothetical protein